MVLPIRFIKLISFIMIMVIKSFIMELIIKPIIFIRS